VITERIQVLARAEAERKKREQQREQQAEETGCWQSIERL
jgi:hypothetical protein